MTTRTTLALPVDVARTLDHTVSQTQINSDTFQGTPDDGDMLLSLIEDAEHEFRQRTNADMRLSRAGSPGRIETYEQLTYDVTGHESYKRSWTQTPGGYDRREVTKNLQNNRILPFDPQEGDEAHIYRGMGGAHSGSSSDWEDVSDEYGETWSIVNNQTGTVTVSPVELIRAMVPTGRGLSLSGGRLESFRMAVSYRYGALGGSRSESGSTTLGAQITDSETGAVSVENASRLPGGGSGGSYVFKLGSEYVSATVDVSNDEVVIAERGVRGTEAASHASGDRLSYTPPGVRKAVAARAGMGLIQSGRYSGWLPDNEDAMSKGDVLDRLEETWSGTVQAMS